MISKLDNLLKSINNLEIQNKASLFESTTAYFTNLHYIRKLLCNQQDKYLYCLKRCFYANNNKAGMFLVNSLKVWKSQNQNSLCSSFPYQI